MENLENKAIFDVDLLFMNVETAQTVMISTHNMIMWHIKTGNHIPVEKFGGIVEYEEEKIAIPWEKLIQGYKPASDEAVQILTYCLNKILDTYQEKIDETRKFLASL